MGFPILTPDGLKADRMIIDDYFIAGETLYAGDAVVMAQDPNTPFLPRVWRVDDDGSSYQDGERAIGIVFTASGDTPGSTVKANAEDLVPVVVLGIAKGVSDAAIGSGDPVVGANTSGRLIGTLTPTAGKMFGKCIVNTTGAGQAFDMLVATG